MAKLGQEVKNERGEYVSGQWSPGKFARWWTNDETCPLCGKQGVIKYWKDGQGNEASQCKKCYKYIKDELK